MVAALIAAQLGSYRLWGRRWRLGTEVEEDVAEVDERRDSLKLRVRLLLARLLRALKVRSVVVVVQLVKLRSRSESGG